MLCCGTQQKNFICKRWMQDNQEDRKNWKKMSTILGEKYKHLCYIYKETPLEGIQVLFQFQDINMNIIIDIIMNIIMDISIDMSYDMIENTIDVAILK